MAVQAHGRANGFKRLRPNSKAIAWTLGCTVNPTQYKVQGMEQYIGVKELTAKPLTLGEYNTYRGWTIPENENPEREGYLVQYADGYESWSPCEVFEEAYIHVSPDTEFKVSAIVQRARSTVRDMANPNCAQGVGMNQQYVRQSVVEIASRVVNGNGDMIVPLATELLAFIDNERK